MATELLGKKLKGTTTVVNNTVTKIPAVALTGRQTVLFQNIGAVTVWIGDENVTAGDDGDNIKLAAGGEFSIDAADGCIIYGITSSGTSKVKSGEGV